MKDKLERRFKVLKEVSIFNQSDDDTIAEIAKALSYYKFDPDVTIFRKDEMGDAMFIIELGSVKVHDGDYVFSVLREDDVFGEYYLVDSQKRSASITTLEETELLRIDQDTFFRLMASNINITKGILKSSIGRLRNMNLIEEELAGKNKEIERQKSELADMNATKDKFFSIIAHDLRGPLGTIMSFFDFLNSSINDLEKKEIIELVKSIHESTDRLLRLLDNLLQWSRVQTGQLTSHKENFDIRPVVDSNLELLQFNAKEKGIYLFSEIEKPLKVFADKNMISTVIRNLIGNAIKFTPSDGKIWVSASEHDSFAHVRVHDTGIGIDKENMDKLFRIDVKHSTPGTNEEKGTGLGLNLCKDFVEKNGGQITVKSTPGKGTVISFTVPKK
ncbi:MAG: cyclic nucleotide-binding domain-containing protein [Bacteroidales bacterium]|nr:cyclic nucleotide-binding domain-containing protein [Bacteroidales bacterium]MCF8388024.1 cyclic nucleotide-binding domain-containing protein [Bacteroidales bacterium]MCF8398291.1 cyclic nucleotide-binding domain-containing protein [Bacteroidales bacterium]